MKTLLLVYYLIAFSGLSFGQGTLEVEVSNFNSTSGVVYLQLFESEDDFLNSATIQKKIGPITSQSVVFSLPDLPEGVYAISVMHDENENGEMDKGTFGIPREGYGFSNNARGMFGPPSFDDSKFTFAADTRLKISLIHPPF